MRKVTILAVWVIWTLMCIYGTYYNTINHAMPKAIEKGGEIEYEIIYTNTGEIHTYK